MKTKCAPSDELAMPLIEAVLDNDADFALKSLRAGANPNLRDRDHPGPWRLLNLKHTGSFLLYESVNLCSRNVRRKHNTGVIEALLDCGAYVNMSDDEGFSATHQAASLNNEIALWVLIRRGADVNLKSKKGYTPLHTAIHGEANACVELLLNAGAKSDLRNLDGFDCMAYARSLHRKDMVSLLESHAAMRAITLALDDTSITRSTLDVKPEPRHLG